MVKDGVRGVLIRNTVITSHDSSVPPMKVCTRGWYVSIKSAIGKSESVGRSAPTGGGGLDGLTTRPS